MNSSNIIDNSNVLIIVRNLLNQLNYQGLSYCNWKSNEHVEASVRGDTDIDLLFDEKQYDNIDLILRNTGYIEFKPPWFRRYPFIKDYIGFDPETGKVVHVHAHFKLILGEKNIKNYHIKWEQDILANRVMDGKYNIYINSPVIEMLLLLIRISLKYNIINSTINIRGNSEISDCNREYEWLKARVNINELLEETKNRISCNAIPIIERIYNNGIEKKEIKRLKKIVKYVFKSDKRLNYINYYMTLLLRYSSIICVKLFNLIGIKYFPNKRTLEGEGIIVALMGSDGSGKSTQIKVVKNKLSQKLDLVYYYMGSGNGRGSIFRYPLDYLKDVYGKRRRSFNNDNSYNYKLDNISINNGILYQAGRIVWSLILAREKKKKLKQVMRARNRGMIVLCDRYPQSNIYGYNDGPLLSDYINSKYYLLRMIANYELNSYKLVNKYLPDIVVILFCDPEVLSNRRKDMSIDYIRKKQLGIKKINYLSKVNVNYIDTGKPIDQVANEIINTINKKIKLNHK